MKKHPIWFAVIGVIILIIPTAIYLCFLVPKMSEEYNVLMASGGIIGGAGLYATQKIPEKIKYSSLFKASSNAFTMLGVILLVEQFITQLVGLVAVFIVSFIIFKILMGVYRDGKRRKENSELAKEIARNISTATE